MDFRAPRFDPWVHSAGSLCLRTLQSRHPMHNGLASCVNEPFPKGVPGPKTASPCSIDGVTMSPTGFAVMGRPGQFITAGGTVKRSRQKKENVPLVVQVRFEPSRLAGDYLVAAYEQLAPIRRRRVGPSISGSLVHQDSSQIAEEGRRAC
jgi:hypothetical protein